MTLDEYLQGRANQAKGEVYNALEDKPDEAARAQELSYQTGIPASVIFGDQENFERTYKAKLNSQLIDLNPTLSDYLNGHPMAAKVSHDDLHNLDGVTDLIHRAAAGHPMLQQGTEAFLKTLPDTWDMVKEGWRQITSAPELYNRTTSPEAEKRVQALQKHYADVGLPEEVAKTFEELEKQKSLKVEALAAPISGFFQILGAPIMGPVRTFISKPGESVTGVPKEYTETVIGALMAFAGAGKPRGRMAAGKSPLEGEVLPPEKGPVIPPEAQLPGPKIIEGEAVPVDEGIARVDNALQAGEPWLKDGKLPPTGVNELWDELWTEISKGEIKALDEALKGSQKVQTKERSPDLYSDYARRAAQKDAHVEISADAIRMLYGRDIPYADDGKLGWIPALRTQLEAAEPVGGFVQVPLQEFLARMDPEIYDALKDDIKTVPQGMTNNEMEARAEHRDRKTLEREEKFEPEPVAGSAIEAVRRQAGLHEPTFSGWDFATQGDSPSFKLPADAEAGGEATHVTPKGPITVPRKAGTTLGPLLDQVDFGNLDEGSKAVQRFFGQRLKETVGHVPVHIIDDAGLAKLLEERNLDKVAPGFYSSSVDAVFLSEDFFNGNFPIGYGTRVLIEEAKHAGTAVALKMYPDLAKAVVKIMEDADLHITSRDPKARKAFNYAFHGDIKAPPGAPYNPVEFVANFEAQPALQKWLVQTPASRESIKTTEEIAKRLGLKDRVYSAWDALKVILKDLYNRMFGRIPKDSAFDQMLKMSEILEETNSVIDEMARAHGVNKGEIFQLHRKMQTEARVEPTAEMADPSEKPTFLKMAIGMNKRWAEQYAKLIEKKNAEDMELEFQRAQKIERARQTEEWKKNQAIVYREVVSDFDKRPDIAVGHLLSRGLKLDSMKLSREQREALPRAALVRGGADPDLLAQQVGLSSGDELVQALAQIESARGDEPFRKYVDRLISKEVYRRMLNEHGQLEENIMNEAIEHVLGGTQMDLLHEELVGLAMKLGTELPLTKEDTKSIARAKFNKSIMGQLSVEKMLREAGKAGIEVEKALLDEKPTEAFRAKQKQYLAMRVADEAKKLEKVQNQFERWMKQYRERPDPKTGMVGSLPALYVNFVQEIMLKMGRPVDRTIQDLYREIDRNKEYSTLQALVEGKNKEEKLWPEDPDNPLTGYTMPVAPFLFDENWHKFTKDMTVEEFKAVADSIKALIQQGRNERKIEVRDNKVDLDNYVGLLRQQLERAYGGRAVYDTTKPIDPQRRSTMRSIGASVLQVESIMNRVDLGNPFGPFTQAIIRPIFEAANYLARLEREYGARFREIKFGDVKKLVPNELFKHPETGESLAMNRGMVLAALQNVGNELQLEKLAKGYGIENPPEVLNWLFERTSKEDWDRAQTIGNMFKEAFGLSQQMYYNLSGVAPEAIELRSIDTPWGRYDGWYHPLMYDPMYRGGKEPTALDLFDLSGYTKPTPESGYTKARTGFIAPIQLNFDAVPFKMKQLLNDVAMRPAITQASKIIFDKNFRSAFIKYAGKEYYDMLEPWLRDAAGQRRYMTPAEAAAGYWVDFFRANTVSSLIGLRLSTVMKHGPTAFGMSMMEAPPKAFLNEVLHLFGRSPESGDRNWKFAYDNSEEVQRRFRNWEETISGVAKEEFITTKLMTVRAVIQHYSAWPVAMSDMFSAVPTWLAVYRGAIEEGLSHADARFLGDRAVRRAHGSSAIPGRPEVMRGGPAKQLFVPFYNFFNTVLQRQFETAWKAKLALRGIEEIEEDGTIRLRPGVGYSEAGLPQLEDGRKQAGIDMSKEFKAGLAAIPGILGGLMAYIIWPSLVEQGVSPVDTRKDGYGMTIGKIVGRDLCSSWPGARDLCNYLLEGHDPSFGMYGTMAKNAVDFIREMEKPGAFSKQRAGKVIRRTNSALGVITGMTNEEIGNLSKLAFEYQTGKAHIHGFGDVWRGVRYGDTEPNAHRPPDIVEQVYKRATGRR